MAGVWRVVLTAVAAVLYGLGWMAAKALHGAVWAWTAVRVGWVEARAVEADDG